MKQEIVKKNFVTASRVVRTILNHYQDNHDALSLEELHLCIDSAKLKEGTDQSTALHQSIYREFDKHILSPIVYCYYQLCAEWLVDLRQICSSEWAVQRYPSVRIHLPKNVSVFEFHRDNDYSHPLGEVNHFLSLTASRNTASLFVEEHLGWDDFASLELDVAESAILNTSIFRHGDHINEEKYTRVSIDFRAIPLYVLNKIEQKKETITKSILLDESHYFIKASEICTLLEKNQ